MISVISYQVLLKKLQNKCLVCVWSLRCQVNSQKHKHKNAVSIKAIRNISFFTALSEAIHGDDSRCRITIQFYATVDDSVLFFFVCRIPHNDKRWNVFVVWRLQYFHWIPKLVGWRVSISTIFCCYQFSHHSDFWSNCNQSHLQLD